jgi:hypothetical protein
MLEKSMPGVGKNQCLLSKRSLDATTAENDSKNPPFSAIFVPEPRVTIVK